MKETIPVTMSSDSIKQSFVFITRPGSTAPIAFYLHPSVPTVLVTSASMKLGYCNPIGGSCSKGTLNDSHGVVHVLKYLPVYLETCSLSRWSSSGVHLRNSVDLLVDMM